MINQELKLIYFEIENCTRELLTHLASLNNIQSKVFVMPRILAENTFAQIQEITPEVFCDFVAESKGKRAFIEYYGDIHVSTKCPLKMAGLLQYEGNPVETSSIVTKVNNYKDKFKKLVISIGDEDEQFRVVHALFPYLITDQLTRHIHLIDPNPKSLGFSFVNKQLSDRISRENAIAMLERQRMKPRDLMTLKEWENIIDNCITRIENLPKNFHLVRRRNGKVQAVSNINYEFGWRQKSASLPLILINDHDVKVKINNMKPYLASKKGFNARPSKRLKSIEISPWFSLFAVQDREAVKKIIKIDT